MFCEDTLMGKMAGDVGVEDAISLFFVPSYSLYCAILLRAVSISDLNGIGHFNKASTESALFPPLSFYLFYFTIIVSSILLCKYQ